MSIELLPEQPGHIMRLGSKLQPDIQEELRRLLQKNVDLFAWRSKDMVDINPEVAVHRLIIKPNVKPIKQKRRHLCAQ